jgi:hypothetical protein
LDSQLLWQERLLKQLLLLLQDLLLRKLGLCASACDILNPFGNDNNVGMFGGVSERQTILVVEYTHGRFSVYADIPCRIVVCAYSTRFSACPCNFRI